MQLTFDFSIYDNITFYGDEVSGFRNLDGTIKGFIADDGLAQYDKNKSQLVIPEGSTFAFSLKPQLLFENDFTFKIDFEFKGELSPFTILEGRNVSFILSQDGMEINSERTTTTYPFPEKLKEGRNVISVVRQDNMVWLGVEGMSGEAAVFPLDGALEITSILGEGMIASDIFLNLIDLNSSIEKEEEIIVEEPVEEEIPDIIEEETPEVIEESVEEESPEVIEEEIETPIKNTNPMKELTEIEKLMISGYEGLLQAIKGTKVEKYYKTVDELQEAASENKMFLIKVFYYVLSAQKEWASATHEEIKVRAYELYELFGKGDVSETGRKYGFAEGVVYKSFKYGSLTDADLTDALVAELLMEEYEGVRALLIKK